MDFAIPGENQLEKHRATDDADSNIEPQSNLRYLRLQVLILKSSGWLMRSIALMLLLTHIKKGRARRSA